MKRLVIRDYFGYSLNFSAEEVRLADEFCEWLPEKIIDCHTHCGPKSLVRNLPQDLKKQVMTTFSGFTLEQSWAIGKLFFPNKILMKLRFPFPFIGVNLMRANQYLLDNSADSDRVAICYYPKDWMTIAKMLRQKKVSALKMYRFLMNPPANSIFEYFTPEILEEAQAAEKPIILHLPAVITISRTELAKLTHDFPKLKVVLAHAALAGYPIPGLEEAYLEFSHNKNVFLDTSMVTSWEVLKLAIKSFGPERILFGTDEPVNLIRSRVYKHPLWGQRVITQHKYHWVNPDEHEQFKHLAENVVHMHWQSLLALRQAIESFPSKDSMKELIFYQNSKELFHF